MGMGRRRALIMLAMHTASLCRAGRAHLWAARRGIPWGEYKMRHQRLATLAEKGSPRFLGEIEKPYNEIYPGHLKIIVGLYYENLSEGGKK
jgi:hypothetical protein